MITLNQKTPLSRNFLPAAVVVLSLTLSPAANAFNFGDIVNVATAPITAPIKVPASTIDVVVNDITPAAVADIPTPKDSWWGTKKTGKGIRDVVKSYTKFEWKNGNQEISHTFVIKPNQFLIRTTFRF